MFIEIKFSKSFLRGGKKIEIDSIKNGFFLSINFREKNSTENLIFIDSNSS